MEGGKQELLEKYLTEWIPDSVVEPKGLWLNTSHPAKKRIVSLMSRCGIYGAALLGARFSVFTSATHIAKYHLDSGMMVLEDVGCVAYPTEKFETAFGYFDLQTVFKRCSDQNRVIMKRDWLKIQQAVLSNEAQEKSLGSWSPIILDEKNPFHSANLDLLLTDSSYEQKFSLQSMKHELTEILPEVSDSLQKESKRWVAYPWRKVAIEMLGPRSFERLLHDRNRNKITSEEQETLAALTVGVVGLSTGHVIAHTMAMEGVCGHIKLADFDTLEVSNLNRIPASLLDLSENKAVICARRIAELNPYIRVEIFEQGLLESNIESFVKGLDIIVEECDSLDVKLLVREAAIKHKIPVLMSTSDIGMLDVERYDIDENPKPFHGLAKTTSADLKDLSRRDKAGYALAIVEGEKVSPRLAASMIEIDHTVSTWAQLASDVTQGAALVTTAVRRIGTGQTTPSSRTRMDMDVILKKGGLPKPDSIGEIKQEMPTFQNDIKQDMVLAASFAPSPGNIQPWKISWSKNTLNLEIDRALTTTMDIKWRGAMVALGAASLNAEIVAAHHDVNCEVKQFPIKSRPDLVTRLVLGKSSNIKKKLKSLYPYLLSRKTNRQLSERQPLSAKVMKDLSSVSKQYPVKLHMLSTPEQLSSYAEISVESDRLRHLCENLHNEMMSELVWPEKDSLEKGIDVRTLGLESKDLNVLPILERPDVMKELAAWDAGQALGDYNRDRILRASAMVVITINKEADIDYVVGGKALQHFWLLAEKNGLSVQPISPIFLYANNDEDIKQLVPVGRQEGLAALQGRFNDLLNIRKGEYPILVVKLSFSDNSEFRSLRKL
jgi:tRNA A37 threonylcarbamoyladenosine dehydratase/nitroreductase